jgi:hypothetical protein
MNSKTRNRKSWLGSPAYWLSGQFNRAPNPTVDREIAAWSEFLGRANAELWTADRRGR